MKGRILRSNISRLILAGILTSVLFHITTDISPAQCTPPNHRVWLRVADGGTGMDSVWFGWEYGATIGLDTWLCEIEDPPAPPSGVFYVCFVTPPSGGLPGGLRWAGGMDYRPYHPGGVDTFRLNFQPGEAGFPLTITWDTALVKAAYDSCLISDEFGGFLVRARMDRIGSVQLTNPAFNGLLILAWQRPPPGTPPATRMRLQISDSGIGNDNLWIGYDPTARPGIDLHLGEFEVPVMPPSGVFFTLLRNPPGHEGADTSTGLGMGSFSDYRTHRGEAAVDTYRVGFQPGNDGFPMHLRWSMDSVRALCDSTLIVDEFGGVLYRKRMDLDSVLTVTHEAIYQLLIIRYGQNPLVHAGQRGNEGLPAVDALEQNYPNPFNGETNIQYRVRSSGSGSWVTLRVYDVLGRVVATLVSAPLPAGEHTATFDAAGLPSGVYIAVLRAGSSVIVRKMALAR